VPSVSAKQAKLFAAVSHGWQPPGRHIDVKVAKEFHAADKAAGHFEHAQRQSTDHHNKYP
jgi:hypothetical protein